MKVSYCTQVFPNTYAKVIKLYSEHEIQSNCKTWKMQQDGIQTANFLKVFKDLIDTLNGGINMRNRSTNNDT